MPAAPPQSARTRQLVATRESAAARQWVERWIRELDARFSVVWFGRDVPAGVPAVPQAQAAHWLGREYDALVFDAGRGLHADALAIAAGLVRGGGVLLLLAPRPGASPFDQRFERFLAEPAVRWVHPGCVLPEPLPVLCRNRLQLNEGQRRAYRRLFALADLPGPVSFVLTAPRGRGKSTLLGALVRAWRNAGVGGVQVTAPNPTAISTLVRVLDAERADAAQPGRPEPSHYIAPDRLLAGQAEPRVLVVDEAAALPVHRLLALAMLAPRTVFATTTAGFEGSGQGFRLRFLRALRGRGRRLHELRLAEPVRWAADDPLEDWVNRLFLLTAEAPAVAAGAPLPVAGAGRRVNWFAAARVAAHEPLLSAVVGLLSDAHYRTRPSDLRRWLDDPALTVGLLRGPGDVLLGVALLIAETGLEAEAAQSVWAGERRPAGQFLPCVLAAHGAFRLAARPVLRIARIAVHPQCQRHGIGLRLLQAAERRARRLGIALIGASFGADAGLLRFWEAAGFQPLRVGFRRETTSGMHAAVVVRPLQPGLRAELHRLRTEIARDWPFWRAGPLQSLEHDVAESVLYSLPPPADPDPVSDREQVEAFAFRQRPFELALPALHRWIRSGPAVLQALPTRGRELLEAATMRGEEWPLLCALAAESGRNGVIRVLRALLVQALKPACDYPEADSSVSQRR